MDFQSVNPIRSPLKPSPVTVTWPFSKVLLRNIFQHSYLKMNIFKLILTSALFMNTSLSSSHFFSVAMLGLLIPEAELLLRNKVSKMVALAAALDATLVGGAPRC